MEIETRRDHETGSSPVAYEPTGGPAARTIKRRSLRSEARRRRIQANVFFVCSSVVVVAVVAICYALLRQ